MNLGPADNTLAVVGFGRPFDEIIQEEATLRSKLARLAWLDNEMSKSPSPSSYIKLSKEVMEELGYQGLGPMLLPLYPVD